MATDVCQKGQSLREEGNARGAYPSRHGYTVQHRVVGVDDAEHGRDDAVRKAQGFLDHRGLI